MDTDFKGGGCDFLEVQSPVLASAGRKSTKKLC